MYFSKAFILSSRYLCQDVVHGTVTRVKYTELLAVRCMNFKGVAIHQKDFWQHGVNEDLRQCTSTTTQYSPAFLLSLYYQKFTQISHLHSHLSTIMAPPKTLNFITGNKNKLTEVKAILGDTIELQSQKLDLVEIQGSIEEISSDKCRRAAEIVCATTPILCLLAVNMEDRLKAQFWWKIHVYVSML
jgi:hypothetical protein